MGKIFGIDLGTSFSGISYGDDLIGELLSSSVDLKEGHTIPKSEVMDGVNKVLSYKIDMSMDSTGELARRASTIVLKELKDRAIAEYGECEDVVISIPAAFTGIEREAVKESARNAGLNAVAIINEPTAAALYICRDTEDLVAVYDLGGGTFDISIIDARDGVARVLASEGKNLGGDDLDYDIMKNIFKLAHVPIRYKTAENKSRLLQEIRQAKYKFQSGAERVNIKVPEMKLEYEISNIDYMEQVHDTFKETIFMMRHVISSKIDYNENITMILAGGSTMCPYLQEMLLTALEELNVNIKFSDIRSDELVGISVGYYAKQLEEGTAKQLYMEIVSKISVGLDDGTSKTIIPKDSFLPATGFTIVTNPSKTDKLALDILQGNSSMSKNNTSIGKMIYNYSDVVEAKEGMITVQVDVDISGLVTVYARESYLSKDSNQKVVLEYVVSGDRDN